MDTPPTPSAAAAQTGSLDRDGIFGLDNVRLDLPLASLGSRTLAATIDYLLLGLLLLVWWVGGLALSAFGFESGWLVAGLVFGSFVLQTGYFAGLEIAMQGRTPGKLAVGLRVISQSGGRASAAAFVVRGLLQVVDLLVGVPMIFFDRRSRRLGDLVAGTLVVHDRESREEELALDRLPAGWGAREVAVTESFLRRAGRLEQERAQELAGRLLDAIERRDPGFVREHRPDLELHARGDRVRVLRGLLQAEER